MEIRESTIIQDRFPYRVFSGPDPVAAFAMAEDAEEFVAWIEAPTRSASA